MEKGRDILLKFIELEEKTQAILDEVNKTILEIKEAFKTEPLETKVDIIWFIQHCIEYLRNGKMALEAFEKIAAMVTTVHWQQATLLIADDEGEGAAPIRGTFATGTPDVKVSPGMPLFSRGPERYIAACEFLGLPADNEAVKRGCVTWDWKRIQELMTEKVANGGVLPKEVFTKVYNEYRILTRGVAGIGTLDCHKAIEAFKNRPKRK